MALPDRVEPWHALIVAAFVVGAGGSLLESGTAAGVGIVDLLVATLNGLLWAFALYVFVGTFRNYVTSYAETGGSLWDPRFLAPFVVGAVAGVVTALWNPVDQGITAALAVDALQVGFWAFVITMVVVLIASYVVAGYREGAR